MLTSPPPLEFLIKIRKFYAFSIIPFTFWGSWVQTEAFIKKVDIFHKWLGIGGARLSNKSYKKECFYFWQYVLWPPPSPTFVKKLFHLNFLTWGWPPSLLFGQCPQIYCFLFFFCEDTPKGKNFYCLKIIGRLLITGNLQKKTQYICGHCPCKEGGRSTPCQRI